MMAESPIKEKNNDSRNSEKDEQELDEYVEYDTDDIRSILLAEKVEAIYRRII